MSSLPCPICGHHCSELAPQCTNCGHPDPGFRVKVLTGAEAEKAKQRRRILKWFLISVVLVIPFLALIADYYKTHPLCSVHNVRMIEISSTRIGNERVVEYECPGPPEHRFTVVRKD